MKTTLSALCLAICASLCGSALASSHREAPNITRLPTVDSTDFYVFNSYEPNRSDYVTVLANYIPLQDPQGGPNYFALDPAAVYNIHFDQDGDAVEDLTFQFRFSQSLVNSNKGVQLPIGPTGQQKMIGVPLKHVGGLSAGNKAALNFEERYELSLVQGPSLTSPKTVIRSTEADGLFVKPYDYVGQKTFGDASQYQAYANQYQYEISIPNCPAKARVFVGQRKDPFVVNLGETFDLVNYVPVEGDSAPGAGDNGGFPGGITQNAANDDLRGKNITTLALELPKACVTGTGNGVIGAWTTASLPQSRLLNPKPGFNNSEKNGGASVQVSRLGQPLVNELVIGVADKDKFSGSAPKDDGQFADYVTHPSLPALLNILFRDAVNTTLGANIPDLAPSNFPRVDLVTAFLTGVPGVNQLAKVTPSEMVRLNTKIAATPAAMQSALGVAGNDLAGFPNGRRPGDDVVDIALRVMMGALCHDIPVNGQPTNLGVCKPVDAPVGNVPFTDGAPLDASMMDTSFPYLRTPLAGSPN